MKSSSSTTKTYKGVTAQYQCEFMENYVAESTVNEGKGIKSLKIGKDTAVIFFISKQGTLDAIVATNGSDSGWERIILSSPGYEAQSFDFYQNEDENKFRLCFSQSKDNRSELLVAEEIVLDEDKLSHFQDHLKFHHKRLQDTARLIDHITMDQRGVLFSSASAGTDALYHYFEYAFQPESYTLPENAKQAKQLHVGRVYGEYGVFILYDIAKARTMLFQSFPETEGGEISQYRFETRGKINCFDLLEDEEGNNILYVAGDGIYQFDTPDSGRKEVADRNITYSKITVSANDDEVTVWALDNREAFLYYLTNTYYQIEEHGILNHTIRRWTQPLKMHEGITEFTAIKGQNFSNQLFLFENAQRNNQSRLIHFWQDEVSKYWQENPIHVADLDVAVKINTYTIDLYLHNNNPELIEEQLCISANENMIVYVNNKKYFLTRDQNVALDFTDHLNIVYPLDSIAVAPVIIAANFFEADLVIDPTSGLQEKIKEKIKSGKDLANAKKQNGKPLLSVNYKSGELDEIANAIATVATHAQELTAPESQPSSAFGAMALAESGFVSGQSLLMTGNAIGDFFYSIKKGFTEITAFVVNKVEEGLQFVIEIAGKVVKWIVDTAKSALAFLERIWEKVKVFFKDLVEFLAFLFDWDDILETKEALSMTVNKCFDGLVPKIEGLKLLVIEHIRTLKKQVDKAAGFDELNDERLNKPLSDLAQTNSQMGTENTVDSRPNWVNSKKEVMFGNGGVNSNGVDTESLKDFAGQAKDPHLKKIVDLIARLFKGELGLGEFIKRMGKVLVDIAFELIEGLVEALFDLLTGSIKLIKDLLNAEIKIPILSDIYKKINNGKGLSILDLTCLLVAIPMTVAYKLASGVAPFSQLSKEEFSDRVWLSIN